MRALPHASDCNVRCNSPSSATQATFTVSSPPIPFTSQHTREHQHSTGNTLSLGTYFSGLKNVLVRLFIRIIEEQQTERLKERHLQLLATLYRNIRTLYTTVQSVKNTNKQNTQVHYTDVRKFSTQNAVAQTRLPLQLAPAVFAQVELLEHFLQPHHLHTQSNKLLNL